MSPRRAPRGSKLPRCCPRIRLLATSPGGRAAGRNRSAASHRISGGPRSLRPPKEPPVRSPPWCRCAGTPAEERPKQRPISGDQVNALALDGDGNASADQSLHSPDLSVDLMFGLGPPRRGRGPVKTDEAAVFQRKQRVRTVQRRGDFNDLAVEPGPGDDARWSRRRAEARVSVRPGRRQRRDRPPERPPRAAAWGRRCSFGVRNPNRQRR